MTTARKKPVRKLCAKCLEEKALSNYYNTSDTDFFPDGKVPICKNCCYELFEEKGFDAFSTLMRLINKPIYDDLLKDKDFQNYIRVINSMPQYKSDTFSDSTTLTDVRERDKKFEEELKKLTLDEFEEYENFFGEGYTEKDYIYLANEYDDYVNRYEVDSKALENLIKEIVITQLDIRKKRAVGEKVNSEQKTLQDLLGSSNLKPVQETGANAVDQESFGTLIRKWENEHPIPEPNPEWKDVDGIRKYVETFFFGHMARLFGKENPHQKEYDKIIGEFTVTPPNRDEDD